MGQPGLLVLRIGKPHGLRGEVTVQVHTDAPEERLRPGATLHTALPGSDPLTIETVRVHQGRYLIGFADVHGRDDAERLRNTKLYLDAEAESAQAPSVTDPEVAGEERGVGSTPDSEPAAYYEDDLMGMAVVLPSGDAVGILPFGA